MVDVAETTDLSQAGELGRRLVRRRDARTDRIIDPAEERLVPGVRPYLGQPGQSAGLPDHLLGPSKSWMSAGRTASPHIRPSVSSRICPLRAAVSPPSSRALVFS